MINKIIFYLAQFNNLIVYSISKPDIKKIFQEVFDVKVVSINTYILPGKKRRLGKFNGFKNSYKRAFVTLLCFN